MPRSSEKSIIRAEFEGVIEDICTVVALETQNRGNSDEEMSEEDSEDLEDERLNWKVIKDLVDIYDMFFEPRYMVNRRESAGQHRDDVLGNLIYRFPVLALFCMKRTSFWAIVELVKPLWNERGFGSRDSSEGRREGCISSSSPNISSFTSLCHADCFPRNFS